MTILCLYVCVWKHANTHLCTWEWDTCVCACVSCLCSTLIKKNKEPQTSSSHPLAISLHSAWSFCQNRLHKLETTGLSGLQPEPDRCVCVCVCVCAGVWDAESAPSCSIGSQRSCFSTVLCLVLLDNLLLVCHGSWAMLFLSCRLVLSVLYVVILYKVIIPIS